MSAEERAAAAMYIFLLLQRLGGSADFTLEDILAAGSDVSDVQAYQDADGLYLRIEQP